MKSIREIYKIGKGPSSSHTMGPERAAKLFKEKNPDADVKVMTCCECAKIVPPSKGSRAFLYENYCATDDWEACSVAQMMGMYYDELEKEVGVNQLASKL